MPVYLVTLKVHDHEHYRVEAASLEEAEVAAREVFIDELADLMLIALNELGDDEIEARRRKFLEKDASPAMPSADDAISKLYKDLLASMPDRKAAEEAMEAMEERKD